MLGHSHASMIVLKFWGGWMVRCMCSWIPKYTCAHMFNALLIKCSHVYLLWCSSTHMSTCLNVHMLLCSHGLIFGSFYVPMFWWSYISMFTSFKWSYTPTSICFDENMSSCLYDFMIICSDTFMIGCAYVNMLRWYSLVWYTQTCAHTWMLKC